MTFQPRQASIDMASVELHNSPAPTYNPTRKSQDWPLTPQHNHSGITSHNPCFQPDIPANKSTHKDDKDIPTKPDYHDPNHPHYTEPLPKTYNHHAHPSSRRLQWPRKCIMIPWALALLFFLTTLWFTSILIGSRFLSIVHPLPTNPPVQEINVYINGEVLRGSVVSETVIVSTTPTASSSVTVAATSVSSTYTGRLQLAATGAPDFDDGAGAGASRVRRRGGFVTVVRDV